MNNFPFHDSNTNPLPDANDIEQEALGQRSHQEDVQHHDRMIIDEENSRQIEADKRKIRNFIVTLLVIGLVIGGVLSIGLVWVMNRLDLINPPSVEQPISD